MSSFAIEPSDGWLRLNTWKEGLLSRMGHDLLIDIRDFAIQVDVREEDSWNVKVIIRKTSFHVVEPDSLSAKDRNEIHDNITKHLPSDIQFEGVGTRKPGNRMELRGTISLGRARTPVSFLFDLHPNAASGTVELSHRALQLKPYRAPLGLIRLQDRVKLTFSFELRAENDGQET